MWCTKCRAAHCRWWFFQLNIICVGLKYLICIISSTYLPHHLRNLLKKSWALFYSTRLFSFVGLLPNFSPKLLIISNLQEKVFVFALSQAAYGACLFLGYWGYYLLFRAFRSSDLFPFRYKNILCCASFSLQWWPMLWLLHQREKRREKACRSAIFSQIELIRSFECVNPSHLLCVNLI
jgi:hypothetical protein